MLTSQEKRNAVLALARDFRRKLSTIVQLKDETVIDINLHDVAVEEFPGDPKRSRNATFLEVKDGENNQVSFFTKGRM